MGSGQDWRDHSRSGLANDNESNSSARSNEEACRPVARPAPRRSLLYACLVLLNVFRPPHLSAAGCHDFRRVAWRSLGFG